MNGSLFVEDRKRITHHEVTGKMLHEDGTCRRECEEAHHREGRMTGIAINKVLASFHSKQEKSSQIHHPLVSNGILVAAVGVRPSPSDLLHSTPKDAFTPFSQPKEVLTSTTPHKTLATPSASSQSVGSE